MEFSTTLKKNHEFRRVYGRGKSAAGPCIVLYCKKNGSRENRVGFTVGTKVGKAVVRNRIRRRLKEIYRLHEAELACGYDIVVVARVRAARAQYRELERSFLQLSERMRLVRSERRDRP